MHRSPLLPLIAVIGALLALPAVAHAAPTLVALTPASVTAGDPVVASGTAPAGEAVRVEQQLDGAWTQVGTTATADAAGAFAVTFIPHVGGQVRAVQVSDSSTSAELTVAVAPKVLSGRLGSGTVYPFLGASATWRVAPADYPDGKVRIELSIDGRSAGWTTARIVDGTVRAKLPTKGVGRFRARLVLPERGGFERVEGPLLAFTVRGRRVGSGSNATWNRALRAALKFRGIYVPGGTSYDYRMGDAVIAFHKAYGRPRTTTFEASDWVRLTKRAIKVRNRTRGMHIEVDKGRQILMMVTNGKPTLVEHISSGATGNTPVGTWTMQWKGDWVPSLYGSLLYKSMSITGAYAIHGYPSVPTYPASHGCVRQPMWIAAAVYRRTPVGTKIIIYEGPGTTTPSVGRRGHDVPELTGVDVDRWADERL